MKRTTVSVCHSLDLIPVSQIGRFSRIGSRVYMVIIGEGHDAGAIPGSVKVSHTSEDARVKIKITFERADVSTETADELERCKSARLVAVYVDESGNRRISGSPNYPLALDYSISGGVFSVTLQGEDTCQDAFLAD